nr:hypothetical protein [Enterobacter cancerogenus]
MRITIDSADQPFIHRLLGEEIGQVDTQSSDTRLQHALDIARQQKNHEAELDWKRNAVFLALFIFLYAVLGASLTLDLTAQAPSHKSLVYALEAVPVLIAFSGLFVSLLFLFFTRSSARRLRSWGKAFLCWRNTLAPTSISKSMRWALAPPTIHSQPLTLRLPCLFV